MHYVSTLVPYFQSRGIAPVYGGVACQARVLEDTRQVS
jgi:hypothetical protein